jgi:hypothetical protein
MTDARRVRPRPPWEELRPDYTNLRGMNFIPAYPRLFVEPPVLPPHLRYRGVASSVAAWRFYDSREIDRQLGWIKSLGCNAVRFWLSHAVWEHDEREREREGGENRFVANFQDFLRRCEHHRLSAMPVLWDERFVEPSAQPYDDISVWVRNPHSSRLTVEWATDPADPYNGDAYVRAVVEAGSRSPALLLWDVMNEPEIRQAWLEHYCDRVREWDPDPAHAITIGFAALLDFGGPFENPVLAHPTLDVLSYHPYGMFAANFAEWTRMARRVSEPPFTDRPKPILATEGGHPGELAPYDRHLDFCRTHEVGYMLFQGMIGHVAGNHPFKESTGFFFHDGELRDETAARALQQNARDHGDGPHLELGDPRQKQDLTGHTRAVVPNGYGAPQVVADLEPGRWSNRPRMHDGNVTTDGYLWQRRQLEMVTKDLGFLFDITYPRGLLAPPDQLRVREFAEEFMRRDLLTGSEPWLLSDPFRVDWPRYDAFFTDWGITLWDVVTRHALV